MRQNKIKRREWTFIIAQLVQVKYICQWKCREEVGTKPYSPVSRLLTAV